MIEICSNCGCSFVSHGSDVCPICFWAAGLSIVLARLGSLWFDITHPAMVIQDWRKAQ